MGLRFKQGSLMLLVLLGLICTGSAAMAAGAMIQIPGECRVQAGVIRVGDIAEIRGVSQLVGDMLADIELGRSPRPGEIRSLDRKRIVSRIQSFTHLPEGLEISAPEKVLIQRMGQTVAPSVIREEVDAYVADVLEGGDIELTRFKAGRPRIYPAGELALTVAADRSRLDRKGNLTLILGVTVDGEEVDRIRCRAKVKLFRDVVVTARTIPRGSCLTEADLALDRRNIYSLRGAPVFDTQMVVGKETRQPLQKGKVVELSRLASRPAIEKGAVVTLVARQGNVRIVTSGITREDGYPDQPIRVENLRSGKVVRGLVRQGTTVEVIY